MRYRILLVAAAALVATGAAIAPHDAARAAVPVNAVQDSSSPAPSFNKRRRWSPCAMARICTRRSTLPSTPMATCPFSSAARRTASMEWTRRSRARALKYLVRDGYIFVFQDIRGRFKSEGAVRDAAPAARQARPEGDRREHRHLRHHRVAAQERAAQQRARRACSACPIRAGSR